MQKAWKVLGMSTTKPEGLPGAFTVVEKEIGEVHQINPLRGSGRVNFVETPNGDVVVYREGVSGSSINIPHGELPDLARFLNHVWREHREDSCSHGEKVFSKCPGTPHRGHFSTAFICPLDQS